MNIQYYNPVSAKFNALFSFYPSSILRNIYLLNFKNGFSDYVCVYTEKMDSQADCIRW